MSPVSTQNEHAIPAADASASIFAGASSPVDVPGAPPIPGLRFRLLAGSIDYPAMMEVINAAYGADGVEEVVTLEQLAAEYDHPAGFVPLRDVLVAEADGRMIAFSRTNNVERSGGGRTYGHRGFVHPGFRRRGLGRAMLRRNEAHLRTLAAADPPGAKAFDSWTLEGEAGAGALLRSEGYLPVRHFFDMVRPDLEGIPVTPLPPGLEIRPVRAEDVRRVFEADNEAFRDHWGHREETEEDMAAFMAIPDTDTSLWVVAWDGDEVAGLALSTIYAADNEAFGRQRGWVDSLAVRRPWRRRGLGRALLGESLRSLRGRGMTSAALGVDTENLSGALGLYESVGFVVDKRSMVLRKALEGAGAS